MSTLKIFLFTFIMSMSVAVQAIPITLHHSTLLARAHDDTILAGVTRTFQITDPVTHTLSATQGRSNSTANLSYTNMTDSATIAVDVSQRTNNTLSLPTLCCDTAVLDGLYQFSVGVDAFYDLSGFFNIFSPAGVTSGLFVELFDGTTRMQLARENSVSKNTANESFLLDGIAEGDDTSLATGALTGELIAGNLYSLNFSFLLRSATSNTGNPTFTEARALGNLTIDITAKNTQPPADVSEPSLFILMLSGLLLLVIHARIHSVGTRPPG